MPIYGKDIKHIFSLELGGLISIKVGRKHRGLKVKVTFYLDQHDLSQRSFINNQASGDLSQDHWSPGSYRDIF